MEKTVEIAVVAAACWPAIRACASAPYRRANPRATLFAVGTLSATAVVTGVAALVQPVFLRAIAALAVAAAAWARWRSRPSYGRSRRLPPGRMTLLPPLAAARDSSFLAAQRAAFGPVFKIGGLRHPVACIVGIERGLELLQRFDDALVVPEMPFSREIPRGFLRYQSRADHARYRRMLGRALSRDLVDSFVPAFDATLRGTVAAMAAATGGARGTGVDVADLLRWIVKMLCDSPEWVERVRADATEGRRSVAGAVTYETLRLAQSELVSRVAARDLVVGGFVIPKGWAVRICVRESHRDADMFPDPERFDPSRFLGNRPPVASFMPFGAHRHACLGEHLTVAIATSFLTALAVGHDVVAVRDGPIEMGPLHWRPSSRFRVRVAARDGAPG